MRGGISGAIRSHSPSEISNLDGTSMTSDCRRHRRRIRDHGVTTFFLKDLLSEFPVAPSLTDAADDGNDRAEDDGGRQGKDENGEPDGLAAKPCHQKSQ